MLRAYPKGDLRWGAPLLGRLLALLSNIIQGRKGCLRANGRAYSSSVTKKKVFLYIPIVNVIKLFFFVTDDKAKYTWVFVTDINFLPSLTLASMAGTPLRGRLLALLSNIRPCRKGLAYLTLSSVTKKKVFSSNIDTSGQCYKTDDEA